MKGLRNDGRRTATGAWEDALPGMTQARSGGERIGRRRGVEGDVGDAAGQGGATEQQVAVTALGPECVMLVGGLLEIGLAIVARHVHGHAHRYTGVMIHRHRLGNQRTDKDHQHGKQADPTAALHAVVWREPGARGAHRVLAY